MDREEIVYNFREACKKGNLILAKKLTETYDITIKDARSCHNYALQWACENGHISTARWLVETFALTTEDVRSLDDHALRFTCKYGHTSTAKWLLNTFYTEDNIEKIIERIIKNLILTQKTKEFLKNYQPFGAFSKPTKM